MVINLLKIAGGAALAALAPVAAMASDGPAASDALYATNAIANGNYEKAEKILRPASYADAADPARLINLATIYVRTHRLDEARQALKQVSALPDEQLEVQGATTFSSHRIATVMMSRLPQD